MTQSSEVSMHNINEKGITEDRKEESDNRIECWQNERERETEWRGWIILLTN